MQKQQKRRKKEKKERKRERRRRRRRNGDQVNPGHARPRSQRDPGPT